MISPSTMASGELPHGDTNHLGLVARVINLHDLDEAGADVEADGGAFTSEEAHAPPSCKGLGKEIFP
jgi:hypothetical protein